jgi:LysM repeat protein
VFFPARREEGRRIISTLLCSKDAVMEGRPLCIALCFLFICAGELSAATHEAPADGIVVVRPGQSLGAVAAQYGVTVRQLVEWNGLNSPDSIRAGSRLTVRPPSAARDATAGKSARAAKPPSASGASGIKAPDVKISGEAPDKVRNELLAAAKTLVNNAARSIRPNASDKEVSPVPGGGFVASYMEVDAESMRVEVIPSQRKGGYVGSIRYVENRYECPGASRVAALNAECGRVKSRRMNELIRYEQGKWHY